MLPRHICTAIGTLWWAPFALAQTTLGALLDAGAKPLLPEEFIQELVQRVIVGPTPTGGMLEVIYLHDGTLQGVGTQPNITSRMTTLVGVSGEWQIDDKGRICTTMRIGTSSGGPGGSPLVLPPRCQYWFKLEGKYLLSDSNTDRSAKVLSRTIKQ